jgi:phage shock protein A
MEMALINRVARLFAADAHAVIDKLEEPDILLKQAEREMRRIVGETAQAVTGLTKGLGALTKSIADVTEEVADCSAELDVCFTAGDDDLARSVVRRRLQRERHLSQLVKQHEAAASDLAQTETELRDRQLALEELEQKICVIDATSGVTPHTTSSVTTQEVEVAFLAEKQTRAGR